VYKLRLILLFLEKHEQNTFLFLFFLLSLNAPTFFRINNFEYGLVSIMIF